MHLHTPLCLCVLKYLCTSARLCVSVPPCSEKLYTSAHLCVSVSLCLRVLLMKTIQQQRDIRHEQPHRDCQQDDTEEFTDDIDTSFT